MSTRNKVKLREANRKMFGESVELVSFEGGSELTIHVPAWQRMEAQPAE